MLGTGARIGEALAVDWEDIDLEQGTVAIQHTVLRLRGEGLVLRRTKSAAGERILELPRWTITRDLWMIRLAGGVITSAADGTDRRQLPASWYCWMTLAGMRPRLDTSTLSLAAQAGTTWLSMGG